MYDVPRDGVMFDVSDGSPKEVRFQSPLPSGCPEVAYLYESANSRGAVMFVHGMGRRSLSWLRFYKGDVMQARFHGPHACSAVSLRQSIE